MPLQAQNPKTLNLNAAAIGRITITARIKDDGSLTASANIVPAQGSVDGDGKWLSLIPLHNKAVQISDIGDLPADIAAAAPHVAQAFGSIVAAFAVINGVRKLA